MRLALAFLTITSLLNASYASKPACIDLRQSITGTRSSRLIHQRLIVACVECPQSCWNAADYGDCSVESNASCLCNEPAFVESLYDCIESTCDNSDIAEYQDLADQLCVLWNCLPCLNRTLW